MPNGRPGDTVLHDILHHRIDTFGPACDGLVRELAARLPPDRLKDLQDIIEPWPNTAEGQANDTDALFYRLAALRDSLDAERRAKRRPGRAVLVALLTFAIGTVGCTLAAGILLLLFGALTGASQFEGAFAMGVAAASPLLGLVGGAALAVWRGWRVWRG